MIPSNLLREFSIVFTHVAQVIPPIFRVVFSCITPYPASVTAFSKSPSFNFVASYSTVAVSFPGFTCASVTPFWLSSDFLMVVAHVAQVIPEILSSAFLRSSVIFQLQSANALSLSFPFFVFLQLRTKSPFLSMPRRSMCPTSLVSYSFSFSSRPFSI
ncbi:hypothetical protein ES705_31623 [subsurface metagenome]